MEILLKLVKHLIPDPAA